MWSNAIRTSSANAMVSSDEVNARDAQAEGEKADDRSHRRANHDREPDARPGTDAVMNVESRRRVGAEPT